MSRTKTPVGSERRKKKERRGNSDRRDLIRFEPEKYPRRSGRDRRKGVQDVWNRRDT